MSKIEITRDYSKFKKLAGNRIPKEKDIERLMESIKASKVVDPVCVNERMEVIDGQHRIEVCKRLGLPISYYIAIGANLATVHAVNSHRKNWDHNSYAESYMALGKEEYKLYNNFRIKYNVPHIAAMLLLTGHYSGTSTDNAFMKGEMKVVNMDKAVDIIEKVIKLGTFYKGNMRRSFIWAFTILYNTEGFDYQRLYNKLAYQSRKMVDCPNTTMYVELLEEIYNYGATKKQKLRFTIK